MSYYREFFSCFVKWLVEKNSAFSSYPFNGA